MKIVTKENSKRFLSLVLSLVMAFSLCMPAFAAEQTEELFASVEALTQGITVSGKEVITATNAEEITLYYSKADPAIGRVQDGWWAGIRVVAPADLSEDELKNVKYRRFNSEGWSAPISFWSAKDSKEGDAVHYMGAWMLVTPELIAREKDEAQGGDGKLTVNYELDWYGNGFESDVQKVDFELDVDKINLDFAPFLGSVEAFTSGITVSGKEVITAANAEEITLYYSKADPAIGRVQDGWWAGIRVVAPADLSEDELKNVKYRRFNSEGWSAPISFWSAKDSKEGDAVHYMGAWMLVTPELIAREKDEAQGGDGKLTINYEFDWYGNGFESDVQKIDFELDVDKINLDHKNHYGTISGITDGLTVSGETDMTIKNEGEITVDFSLADMSVGRYMDAWWVGAKIVAPSDMTEEELKDSCYRIGNGDVRSFWEKKDSQDGAREHYITIWLPVIQEYIDNDADGVLNWVYEFDWDGNGFGISTQKFTVSVDVNKINRIHSAGCTKVVEEEAVTPDCINPGQNEKSYCSVCGLILGDGAPIDPLGHDFSEKIIDETHLASAKTCTEYAKYYLDCSRCDVMSEDTFENVEEGLEPHIKQELVDDRYLAAAVSCETPAEYYVSCEVCGNALKDETFTYGASLGGHIFMLEEVSVKAGLGKDGAINFRCADCGELDNEPIPFAGIESVTISETAFDFTGKAITPAVTVKDREGVLLTKDTDYTVSYSANKAPGTASVKVNFIGKYEGSKTLSFTIRQLPATGKLSASASTNQVTLSWNKVNGATGYKVYDANGKQAADVTGTSVTVKSLSSATKYSFTVKAYAVVDGKAYISTASKSVSTVTKPLAVSSLSAAATTSAVTLKWGKVTGAEGYNVYLYNSKTKKYDLYKTVTGTSLTVNSLKSATAYTFRVAAVKLGAEGEAKSVSATTKPLAVSSLSASVKASELTLKWGKVTGADSYNVYIYNSKTKKYDLYKTVTGTSLTVKSLKGATTYAFKVAAVKSKLEGAATTLKATTKPAGVSKLTASVKTTSVTLKWGKVTGADSYNVYLYNSKTKKYDLYKSVTGTSLTVKSLKSATTYAFKVAAVKAKAEGSAKTVKATTKPGAVSKLTASVKTTSVTLKWSKVSRADSYNVYKYNSKTKSYDLYKNVKGTSLTIKGLKSATTYAYCVRAVKLDSAKAKVTGEAKSVSATTKPLAVSKVTAAATSNSVTLKWDKVKGADDYRVYIYNAETKKYELYKNVTGTKLTVKNLDGKTKYTFTVRAAKVTADGEVTLAAAKKISVKTKVGAPAEPEEISISVKSGKATVKWSKVTGADGYQIAYKDGKTGKNVLMAEAKPGDSSASKKGFTKGIKYVFGVRAYRVIDGKRVYSSFTIKNVKMK